MAHAREFNFPPPVPFDYATANVSAAKALGLLARRRQGLRVVWRYGDVGAAGPELEKELFRFRYHSEEDNQMSNLTYFGVKVEGATEIKPIR